MHLPELEELSEEELCLVERCQRARHRSNLETVALLKGRHAMAREAYLSLADGIKALQEAEGEHAKAASEIAQAKIGPLVLWLGAQVTDAHNLLMQQAGSALENAKVLAAIEARRAAKAAPEPEPPPAAEQEDERKEDEQAPATDLPTPAVRIGRRTAAPTLSQTLPPAKGRHSELTSASGPPAEVQSLRPGRANWCPPVWMRSEVGK